jgi:hypothetical protein
VLAAVGEAALLEGEVPLGGLIGVVGEHEAGLERRPQGLRVTCRGGSLPAPESDVVAERRLS